MPVSPSSPPKRMTRARAKAVEEKQKTTTITTPAARVATAAAKQSKRKTNANAGIENEDSLARAMPDPGNARPTKQPAAQSRQALPGRVAKATKGRATNTARNDQGKDSEVEEKLKGRLRKKVAANGESQPESKPATAPVGRTTRATSGTALGRGSAASTAASRKKVTFQGSTESEKENIDSEKVASDTAMKRNGKPGRPITGVPATRSIRNTKATGATGRTNTQVEPLSPKKPQQVAKGVKSLRIVDRSGKPEINGNGTILCTNETGIQSTKHNPEKKSSDEIFKLDASVDELQLPSKAEFAPTKEQQSKSGMSSPPRRLPLSPFKDAMKASPRRLLLSEGQLPESQFVESPHKASLSQSPKKLSLDSFKQKPALQPSSEVKFGTSLSGSPPRRPISLIKNRPHPISDASPPKLGASLLGSPARHELFPSKSNTTFSPSKVQFTTRIGNPVTPSLSQRSPARQINFSPSRKVAGAYKAAGPPETQVISPELASTGDAGSFDDELAKAPSPAALMPAPTTETGEKKCGSKKRLSCMAGKSCNGTEDARHIETFQECPERSKSLEASSTPSGVSPVRADSLTLYSSHTNNQDLKDDSDDELQSSDPRHETSPSRRAQSQHETPVPIRVTSSRKSGLQAGNMTALAERFGAWTGATPDSAILERRKADHTVFSPLKRASPEVEENITASPASLYMGTPHQLDNVPQIPEEIDERMLDAPAASDPLRQSQSSENSQDYGDENAIPIDPVLLEQDFQEGPTCTPARVFAPQIQPHVLHTVSKVPLKDSSEDNLSPSERPRVKRSRSLSSALTPRADLELQALRQIHPRDVVSVPLLFSQPNEAVPHMKGSNGVGMTSIQNMSRTPETKADVLMGNMATPRTPRADLNSNLLNGVVAYTDVHTTEGADASGIFVDLLNQMGARCIKQWNWTPTGSLNSEDGLKSGDVPSKFSRMGITHVIFKDGGKRTMEKVREAKGLVSCVGVGWVLDCERENKWLDEAQYAIDISTIPRGGHRRRKSMEPRSLINENGTISAANSPNKLSLLEMSPTKEFLNLSPESRRVTITSTPVVDRRVSFAPMNDTISAPGAEPMTPVADDDVLAGDYSDSPAGGSPTTPYFLHREQLVQRTCPPKQTQELLFPLSGRIADQPDNAIKHRLQVARRKSLQFAPKVGSPLARDF